MWFIKVIKTTMQFIKSYPKQVLTIGVCLLTGIIMLGQNKPQSIIQSPASAASPVAQNAYQAGVPVNFIRVWEPMGAYTDASMVTAASYLDVRQTTQYFDGLGRPLQTVQKQVTPAALDMVAPVIYDELGREQYKYPPYVQTSGTNTNDGSFKMNPFGSLTTFYQGDYKDANNQLMLAGEQFFYSKTNFEASPLNRIEKEMARGNGWTGNNVGVEMKYLTNTSTDDIRIWNISSNALTYVNEDVSTNIPSSTIAYGAGQLYKNVTIDERGKAIVEYKDKEGKLILKKAQIGTVPTDFSGYNNWLCTYYIYDELNQLRFVIPPKAVDAIKTNWSFTTDIISELCFRYEYDPRERMIAKKVPGAGWTYMIYDIRDRLVFTQDAKLRASNKWMATLYDELNRPVLTGLMIYSSNPTTLQQTVNTQTAPPSNPNTSLQTDLILSINMSGTKQAMRSITMLDGFESTTDQEFTAEIVSGPGGSNGETTVIEDVEVNKNPIPGGAPFTALTVTFYDNYNFTNTTYTTAYNSYLNAGTNLHTETMPLSASMQIKGMAIGSKIRVLEDPNNPASGRWLITTNFYDEKGRVIQTHSENYSGGTDIQTTLYSFTGKALSNYLAHRNPGSSTSETRIRTDYTYDHAERVTEISKVINDDSSKKATIAKNSYDALGNLLKKELGKKKNSDGSYSANPLEILDYTYNIRGWMKGINAGYSHPELAGASAESDRYFGMELSYDWGFDQNQLNGNIGGMRWRSKGDGEQRAYGFAYDDANRLLKADFTQNNSGWNTSAGVDFSIKMGDGINVTTAYDANGNILQMQQWGLKLNTSPQIDNLTYLYQTSSNKLARVTDANNDPNTKLGDFKDGSNTGTDDYSYDVNGNLGLDNNKNISSITYNHLNLPSVITITGMGTITYTYDAAGNKLRKVTIDNTISPAKTTTTDYMTGAVYENNVLQFIGHEEGRIRPGTSGFNFDYFIKDHLGNVRIVLTEELKQDKYPVASLEDAKVNTEDDYYTVDQSKIVSGSTVTGLSTYTNDNGIGNNPSDPSFEGANSAKLYKLNSTTNKTGLGITLKVMAGDKIDIFGKSYYFQNNTGGSGVNSSIPFLEILNGLIGSPNGTVGAAGHGEVTATQLSGLSATTNGIQTLLTNETTESNSNTQRPKAYINYLLFDEQFKCVGSGFSPVGGNSTLKDHHPELQNIPVIKNGYVYIYCSNESPVNVFFDNLQVVHTRGPILEETHYYPFGLVQQGISSKALSFGEPKNKEKTFQGQRFDDELGLNWIQFKWRNHDPQIGRFIEIDPLSEKYEYNSTYAFSENKVTNHIELEGLESTAAGSPAAYLLEGFRQWFGAIGNLFSGSAEVHIKREVEVKTEVKTSVGTASNTTTTTVSENKLQIKTNFGNYFSNRAKNPVEISTSSSSLSKVETKTSASIKTEGAPIKMSTTTTVDENGKSQTTSVGTGASIDTKKGGVDASASAFYKEQLSGAYAGQTSVGVKVAVDATYVHHSYLTIDKNIIIKTSDKTSVGGSFQLNIVH
jgi:RHS repeat-associated protein